MQVVTYNLLQLLATSLKGNQSKLRNPENIDINSIPAGKKQAKFTTSNVYFISQKLFAAMRPTISHFKVHKMGFSEKNNLIVVTQHFSEKLP